MYIICKKQCILTEFKRNMHSIYISPHVAETYKRSSILIHVENTQVISVSHILQKHHICSNGGSSVDLVEIQIYFEGHYIWL